MIFFYNTILGVMANEMDGSGAADLLREMNENGVTPNARSVHMALKAARRSGDSDLALKVYKEWSRIRVVTKHFEIVKLMIDLCVDHGLVDDAVRITVQSLAHNPRFVDATRSDVISRVMHLCEIREEWMGSLKVFGLAKPPTRDQMERARTAALALGDDRRAESLAVALAQKN
jgi:pentatricopeptide repeat protein